MDALLHRHLTELNNTTACQDRAVNNCVFYFLDELDQVAHVIPDGFLDLLPSLPAKLISMFGLEVKSRDKHGD